ncbi:MAG: PD40 domain-containing protein [Chloroflexi bacterium]|nr:PD40 domain-containing protein [Chloroflexota bacterium]
MTSVALASLVGIPMGGIALGVSGTTERVSVASGGVQANNPDLRYPLAVSADGRYVAFTSDSETLVAGDTNGMDDVFVHDRQADTTERISVASDGSQAQVTGGTFGVPGSYSPALSADGRYVAFMSYATNLVAGDSNGLADIFIRDRQAGTTERVSVANDGSQARNTTGANIPGSVSPALSADGRYVTFYSDSGNLVAGDTNSAADIFVRDRQMGTTERVSLASGGIQANESSRGTAALSADGRYVAFMSFATNLVAGDTNGLVDVFVRDRQMGTTERVSVASSGSQANNMSDAPALSADGRYVAFMSFATNLVAGDTNGMADVFVRDRQTGTTERVSVASSGSQANNMSDAPALSADGRFVAFTSSASNLVPGDTHGMADIFVRDRQTGTTERVSVASSSSQANNMSADPTLSADGRFVAFKSWASNLVPGDTNDTNDVFVRDRLGSPNSGDTTRPSCGAPVIGTDAQNRTTLTVKVQDNGSGIAGQGLVAAQLTQLTNATVTLSPAATAQNPPGTPGLGTVFTYSLPTTAQVTVVATKTDQALPSHLGLKLTDATGNVTACDPLLTLTTRETGKPVSQTLTGIPQAESVVTITNATPGVKHLDIVVNGRSFKLNDLRDGEMRTLSIASALEPRDNNTIVLTARGKPGGSAQIMVSDR